MPNKQQKPAKPYPGFPLYAHRNGQWAKKILKRPRYFGAWDDPDAALKKYLKQRDALYAGQDPADDSINVADGLNAYIQAKQSLLASGEITQRTFDEYESTCKLAGSTLGHTRQIRLLTPADFDNLKVVLAKNTGPTRLAKLISIVRGAFGYLAHEDVQLIEKPVRFGPHFRRPKAHVMRIAKAQAGKKLFTNEEIHALLDKANVRLKAMIYLAINCGLGNTDICKLRHDHLDLAGGWMNYPRNKTGIERRAKLWPETVSALRKLKRKNPQHDDLVFLTFRGNPWITATHHMVSAEFTKVLTAAKLRRKGLSFYALRHTFQTVAEKCRDLPAVSFVMGHVPPRSDMPSRYREEFDDARLKHVANYMRAWLAKGKRHRAGRRRVAS